MVLSATCNGAGRAVVERRETVRNPAKAPRITRLAFRGLPGGVYSVRAVLKGANDEELAQTRQEISVVSRAIDR
jgi:hypothetical protein